MSKGGRVNAFAVSPRSPLAGIPRGITSAGVGKMTRRLTVSKSFLRDYFNVEALARGEHGEMRAFCECVSGWSPLVSHARMGKPESALP